MLWVLLAAGSAWAQQVWEVDVSGEEYQPGEITVWAGDTVRFCNQGIWRRQPYTSNQYNRMGSRTAETFEMLKKGECKNLKIRNPTQQWLKFTVHDAVSANGKIKINVNPGKGQGS